MRVREVAPEGFKPRTIAITLESEEEMHKLLTDIKYIPDVTIKGYPFVTGLLIQLREELLK